MAVGTGKIQIPQISLPDQFQNLVIQAVFPDTVHSMSMVRYDIVNMVGQRIGQNLSVFR